MRSQLSTAIRIAADAHDGQFDKGGHPYILHPLKVMHYTKSDDEEIMAIAVLHDVVEDNKKITYSFLRSEGLSERIIEGVRAMTKIPGESYNEYIERLKQNRDAIIVKMADLRHNSDLRRLKGVTQKDIDRSIKYQKTYMELQLHLEQNDKG
jgi:(p)ppGpp synthase/HD superfamily hydrolase